MEIEGQQFRSLLKQYTKVIPNTPSQYSTCVTANVLEDFKSYTVMKEESVFDLREVAGSMESKGYHSECVRVYKIARKEFLEAAFERLNILQPITKESVKMMKREDMEVMNDDCRRALRVCIEILFQSEKTLCDQIFQGLGAEDVFPEVIKDHATQLLDFAEALSFAPPKHDNLIKLLALHHTLSELLPEANALFRPLPVQFIRDRASMIAGKLADVVKGIITEFPKQVLGSILSAKHQEEPALPRYVMKIILSPMVSEYEKTLSELIVVKPVKESYDLANKIQLGLVDFEGQSPLSLHLMWIIVNLMYNLKGTAKAIFEDSVSSYRFTMKNVSYIVEKIEGCPQLKRVIGDRFVHQLRAKLYHAIDVYVKLTSENASKCLHVRHFTFEKTYKENMVKFNGMFEDLIRTLATIVVSNSELRERYRESFSSKLVPVYRPFYNQLEKRKLGAKYTPNDLTNMIKIFFRDSPQLDVKW